LINIIEPRAWKICWFIARGVKKVLKRTICREAVQIVSPALVAKFISAQNAGMKLWSGNSKKSYEDNN
jgi:hypothetical protein